MNKSDKFFFLHLLGVVYGSLCIVGSNIIIALKGNPWIGIGLTVIGVIVTVVSLNRARDNANNSL